MQIMSYKSHSSLNLTILRVHLRPLQWTIAFIQATLLMYKWTNEQKLFNSSSLFTGRWHTYSSLQSIAKTHLGIILFFVVMLANPITASKLVIRRYKKFQKWFRSFFTLFTFPLMLTLLNQDIWNFLGPKHPRLWYFVRNLVE